MHLSIPTNCDNCCSLNIELITNRRLLNRGGYAWAQLYVCHDCGASTGVHPNTKTPLGKMANLETRNLRVKAHIAFDPLWKNGYMTRSRAYNWLALELGIELTECHISWLSTFQLGRVITICKEYISTNRIALERRKVKHNARDIKRNKRTARRIHQRKAGY